ncbi:site-specific DNA-methyltransferase [Histidinibacterium aquaticum]|uniref:site-specific DNA-methyltransferase (adenine-specific) n=1 Tax=Histidinibacterium aquaticum TaxID=2613962 RepID=A0A5J5GL36_9RHOB|nr:DNA methyltransferase [Histidinibacterium aquaticum]KAA9008747.1 site-specific DNA-methyltransferase [Histidinibacterium aquaticum]
MASTEHSPAPSNWAAASIEQRALSELKHYRANSRSHGDRDVAKLAASIRQFGFVTPILIDDTDTIICGHGRALAAERLGLAQVPTIRAGHLSDAEVRALRIADNRLAELSEWDRDTLKIELGDLADLELAGDVDFDLTLTGFEMGEIDLLIDGETPDEAPEEVEEPERARSSVTQPGDAWTLGQHKILCADALKPESYAALLEGEVAAMVFTDPPYNVPVQGHVRTGREGQHREFAMASGEMSRAEFEAFLGRVFAQLEACLRPGGIAMVCMDWRHIQDLLRSGEAAGFDLLNLCVWNKSNGGMGSLYRSKHELVAVFKKPGAAHVNNVELGKHGRYRTNVWDYAGVNSFGRSRTADLTDHPTVKPTALVADAIRDVSRRGEVVLDVFGGSGSTLLAAEKSGRTARLVELDPAYVDVTIRRWQALTGKSAVHVATGERFEDRAASIERDEEREAADAEA